MYTIEELKRCLMFKLNKKYKNDKGELLKLLTDYESRDYKGVYDDCLLNCFLMLLKEYKDTQTISYLINKLLSEVK